ncbi:MAG: TorF family putative porin [Gallionellaceae bacterium]|nr:TorF family putative porin [Gallionellaceae bacterium]MDD5365730.1 TorF family putative porin [Gallionellaceae bacterium]
MNKLVTALVLSGLATTSFSVLAEDAPASSLAGNIGIATDYIFRGVSQTQNQPEISGGFDYTHSSGLYVGTWLSNQDWVQSGGYKDNSSLEVDLYGGYRGTIASDVGYDVGLITYYYPGNSISGVASPDTTEIYLGASWKFLSLKYSHVVSSNFIGWVNPSTGAKSRDSNYIELNANYDLGDGWGVLGHVGHQVVNNFSDADYTDWKLGVSKDIGYGVVSLAYTDTDATTGIYTIGSEKIAESHVILSFTKSF